MCYVMCFLLDYFSEKLQEKLTLLFKTFLEMDLYVSVRGGWLDVVLYYDWAQGDKALSGLHMSGLSLSQLCLPWYIV